MLDGRLVPAAVCCWVATLVALTLGWCAGLVLAVASLLAAIGLWVALAWAMAHRRERWRVIVAAALAAMVAGAGFALAGSWRAHEVQAHPLRESFGRSVEVVAVVTDDPKPVRGAGFGDQRRWVIRAGLREFGTGATRVRARGDLVVLASGAAWERLGPGQRIRFRARVSEPDRPDLTVAALHAQDIPELVGRPPWWQRGAGAVRTDLAAAAQRGLSADAAGLLPAMVVGDTSHLSGRVRDAFETAGLQHLNVVSGANFTILLTVALAILRVVSAGPRVGAGIAILVVGTFVLIARPDPSVLRAAAMGSVTVLSLVTGRRKQALPALCAAVIGLLAVTPALATSAGFALSVAATAGLILLAPSWADWLRGHGWWRAPAEVVAVAAAAFVVTLPLMIALSGKISLVAVAANILVAPVVGVITVIGAAGASVAVLSTGAGAVVLWCAALPLWWLLTVADTAAGVPGATVTVPSGIAGGLVAACVVALAVVVLRSSVVRRLCAAILLGVAAVLVPVRLWHPFWPPPGWVVAMCDVGQGDAFAVSTGPGSAVVIDVGPDPRPVRRCLDRLGIDHVPLLVLTHPHADHIAGLEGALHHRTVDAIATAPAELHTVATRLCPDRAASAPTAPAYPPPDVPPPPLPRTADSTPNPEPTPPAHANVDHPIAHPTTTHPRPASAPPAPAQPPLAQPPPAQPPPAQTPPAQPPLEAHAPERPTAAKHTAGPTTSAPTFAQRGHPPRVPPTPALSTLVESASARRASEQPAHAQLSGVQPTSGYLESAQTASARSTPSPPASMRSTASRSARAPGALREHAPVRSTAGSLTAGSLTAGSHTAGPTTSMQPPFAQPPFAQPPSAQPPSAQPPFAQPTFAQHEHPPRVPTTPALSTLAETAPTRQAAVQKATAAARSAEIRHRAPADQLPPTAPDHVHGEPSTGTAHPGEPCSGRSPSADVAPPPGVTDIPEIAAAHGVPIMELHSGHSFGFGRVELDVLAPGPEPPFSLAQDEANDRSLVLRARTPAGTVLFTGDIESGAQQRLLATQDVRADILKVPHHGSRTTIPAFLAAVRPVLALTSAGRDNTFGHPHPRTLAALEQLGATVARTDRDGDVLVLGTPGSLRIVRARPRRCRCGSVGSQRDRPTRTPAARRRGTAGRTRDGADNPRGPRRRAGPGRRAGRPAARR
ncbi:ComEC/Rec2 family competence protein [Nocardia thailandica]